MSRHDLDKEIEMMNNTTLTNPNECFRICVEKKCKLTFLIYINHKNVIFFSGNRRPVEAIMKKRNG